MENESIKKLENLNNKVKEWNNAKCSPTQLAEELDKILKDMSIKYFGDNLHSHEIYMCWAIIKNLNDGEFTEEEINKLAEYVYNIWLNSFRANRKND